MAEPPTPDASVRVIALFYAHVASNVGDLAINAGQIALLRQVYPQATIRVVLLKLGSRRSVYQTRAEESFGPSGTVQFSQFRAYDIQAQRYALDPGRLLDDCAVDDADLVVLSAGEHLFALSEHPNRRNMFWRTLPAFAARHRGRRCLIMPSTLGPFEDADSVALVDRLYATEARGAVRELRSLSLLSASNASAKHVTAALDPAFFVQEPTPGAFEPQQERERVFAFVMRSEGKGLRLTKEEQEAHETRIEQAGISTTLAHQFAKALVSRMLASRAKIRLVVQTEADRVLAEAIAAEFSDVRDTGRLEVVVPESVGDYLDVLADVDAVVASRFHAIVLGLVAARPCFGVYFAAHGHKIPGLFELLEHPELALELSGVEPDTAADAVMHGVAAAGKSQPTVRGKLMSLRQATRDWLTAEWSSPEGTLQFDDVRVLGSVATKMARAALESLQSRATRLPSVEADLDAVRRELAQLRDELRSERDVRLEREAEIEILGTRFRELELTSQAEASRLNSDILAARSSNARQKREIEALRSQVKRDRQLHARVRDELVARIDALERSESFRIGYALVRIATSPRRLLNKLGIRRPLPGRTSREKTIGNAGEPMDTEIIGGLTPTRLVEIFDEGGGAAVIAAVREQVGVQPAIVSAALVKASRMLRQHRSDAEYHLVSEGLRLERSDQNLRTMFWTAQRSGNMREAWECLAELESVYGPVPTRSQAQWLKKARNGAIMYLALFDEILLANRPAYKSEANRICYVLHNSLPYSSGGYATRAHGLAQGLGAIGIETVCISRPGYPVDMKPELAGSTLPAEDVIDGISYRRLWEPSRDDRSFPRYARSSADAFEMEFRKSRPAVVVAASAYLSALPALMAAKRLGIPFVYEVRGFWEITRLSRQPEYGHKPYFHVIKLMEAEIANNADHVFTLTGPMRDELIDRGVDGKKITLLPNSCDATRFTPRPRDTELAELLCIPASVPVIGYIGTFVQYEGLEHLTQACALLKARGVEFRLMLVGNENTSGSDRGKITMAIEEIAAEGGISDWLIMPGRVPHAEVESYYSLIDIAPFPRKPQPVTEMVSPMKPLEALAMEKAVVVSSVRALVEMISDGETGLVFEKGNVDSLTDSLERLARDPALRSALGRAGRKWVERERTWRATAEHAHDVIRRLIKDARSEQASEIEQTESPAAPPATVPSADEIYSIVRDMYIERDKARGKVRFPKDDWARTKLAFEMIDGVATVVDIGVGQAQLVNLLARRPTVRKIYGFDFRDYSTRIDPPANGCYEFRCWDITRPLASPPAPVDVVVAMEVLEHIEPDIMPEVFDRLRALASNQAILLTVPYQEKEPLYHHNKKHGHKQSFDDDKVERLFGPGCLVTNYKRKWYFVFCHRALGECETMELPEFTSKVQTLLRSAVNPAHRPQRSMVDGAVLT